MHKNYIKRKGFLYQLLNGIIRFFHKFYKYIFVYNKNIITNEFLIITNLIITIGDNNNPTTKQIFLYINFTLDSHLYIIYLLIFFNLTLFFIHFVGWSINLLFM